MSEKTDTEIMREILEFSAHKFTIRVDGQQLIAAISAIELACRHPSFHGANRMMAEGLVTSLKRIATRQAPGFDLLHGACNIGWIPDDGRDNLRQ